MTDAEDGEVEFGLVMPFVVCQSQGGPYEDQTFCAGWALGQLDELLGRTRPAHHHVTVVAGSVPQIDLIAMRHGYVAVAGDEIYGWRSAEDDDDA